MKFFAFGTNNSAIITISITGKALSPSSLHSLKTSKEQTLNSIQNVQLLHGYHLYWPDLDVDLEIDNLENPEKHPLKSKIIKKHLTSHSTGRRIAAR